MQLPLHHMKLLWPTGEAQSELGSWREHYMVSTVMVQETDAN